MDNSTKLSITDLIQYLKNKAHITGDSITLNQIIEDYDYMTENISREVYVEYATKVWSEPFRKLRELANTLDHISIVVGFQDDQGDVLDEDSFEESLEWMYDQGQELYYIGLHVQMLPVTDVEEEVMYKYFSSDYHVFLEVDLKGLEDFLDDLEQLDAELATMC